MDNLKVVSLFSGVGGLDFGFAQQGCRIVFANDFNRFACETYRHNFNRLFGGSDHLVEGDITKCIDKIPYGTDLLLAGAPCQSWSMAGKRRGFEDERGSLLLTTVDILKSKSPRFFIWENVAGLLSHNDGQSFKDLLQLVQDAGYVTQYALLNFSEYGVSQRRHRVIIWGKRNSEEVSLDGFIPKKSLLAPKSLGTLLKINASDITSAPNHIFYKGSKMHDLFGQILLPGENAGKLQEAVAAKRFAAKGISIPTKMPGGFRPVYRLSPHEVAPTMVFNGGTNVPYHPWENRCLSITETALIQGFPIDFEFKGNPKDQTYKEQYKQVANAVPPLISTILAQAFVNAISLTNKQ